MPSSLLVIISFVLIPEKQAVKQLHDMSPRNNVLTSRNQIFPFSFLLLQKMSSILLSILQIWFLTMKFEDKPFNNINCFMHDLHSAKQFDGHYKLQIKTCLNCTFCLNYTFNN